MSRSWISITITIIIIGLSLTDIFVTAHINEKVQTSIQEIESLVSQKKMEEAAKSSKQIEEDWNGYHEILAIFITHEYLESVDTSIAKIKASLDCDDTETFWEESASIKVMMESIKTTEYPTISNIL